MSRKALGRGLGDLLNRARPARSVERASQSVPEPSAPATASASSSSTDAQPLPPATSKPPASDITAFLSTAAPSLFDPIPKVELPSADHVASPTAPLSARRAIASSNAPAPSQAGRMPHFGPAYTPPPTPASEGGNGKWLAVAILDFVLLALAAAAAFGPWLEKPASLYAAGGVILLGSAIACLALVFERPGKKPSAGAPKPSHVRVRLTRL